MFFAYQLSSLLASFVFLCHLGLVSADGTCDNLEGIGCQASGDAGVRAYWPYKNFDLNRTGFSPHVAPFDLSKPTWIFEEPEESFAQHGMGLFHSSPILDGELNVYIASVNGIMYSLTKLGVLRWTFKFSGRNPGNPALLNSVLYTASDDGMAYALEAATGTEIWSVRIGMACPDDAWSAIAINGTVIMPATPEDWQRSAHKADMRPTSGGDEIVALYTIDGQEKWRYNHAKRAGTASFNVIPAIVNGSVVFDDMAGGVFRLSFEDGKEQWYTPGPNGNTFSTGAALVGPQNMIYVARNRRTEWGSSGNDGFVRAHDLHTGKLLWDHGFSMSMNVGLAVGPLKLGGRLAVIAVPGNNDIVYPQLARLIFAYLPQSWYQTFWSNWRFVEPLSRLLNTLDARWHAGERRSSVVALDAKSGELIWSLDLAVESMAMPASTLRPASLGCAPDIAGNPAIGADGTVYVSWSGGKVFAIRDANEDGKIDATDPHEVSFYPHGFGSNGNSAIGPGFLAVPSCNGVLGFVQG